MFCFRGHLSAAQKRVRLSNNSFGGEAELLKHIFDWRRRAKSAACDYASVKSHVITPAQTRPASTATLADTDGGSALSRYSFGCCSKSSQLGMLTESTIFHGFAWIMFALSVHSLAQRLETQGLERGAA